MPDHDGRPVPASEDHAHASDHGHVSDDQPLGPVDMVAWAYALAGSVAGLAVVVALFVARGA